MKRVTVFLTQMGRRARFFCAVLSMVCLGSFSAQGQVVVDEGFEQACSDPDNAFFDGCVPGWISASLSPGIKSIFSHPGTQVLPYQGSQFMCGRVIYYHHCPSGIDKRRGDGVAINYNFQAGVTYKLSYAHRTNKFGGGTYSGTWYLTNGLPNQSGAICEPEGKIPNIPAGSVLVQSNGVSNLWDTQDTVFTPSANFGQLWFRAIATPSNPSGEINGHYFLDAVSIEIICNPYAGVAAFNFEDTAGIHKDRFCYGEDVFIDGSASESEDRYYIDLWRRPIGSPNNFDWVSGLGWTVNQQVGVINLSDAFANIGYYFQPGYEYRVKLAIANPPFCIPWTEVTHEFVLECCDGFFSADFGLRYDGQPGSPAYLQVHSFQSYASLHIPVTHTWTVLASPNENGGPYTLVNTMTTTGAGPYTVFDDVQAGIYYTVIHTVETACGKVCYGKQRYGVEGGMLVGEIRDNSDADCELCGPIDCSLLDRICLPPANVRMRFVSALNSWIMSWSSVPGVQHYVVEINYGCEEPGQFVSVSTLNTFYILGGGYDPHGYTCLTYRVGYRCPGEEYMVWSDWQLLTPHFASEDSDGAAAMRSQNNEETKMYPNPTKEDVNLLFSAPFTGLVRVMDMTGRAIMTQNIENQLQTSFSVADLPNGVYWVLTQAGTERKVLKLVKN